MSISEVRKVVHTGVEQMAKSYTARKPKPAAPVERGAPIALTPGADPWADCPHCAARRKQLVEAQKRHRAKAKR